MRAHVPYFAAAAVTASVGALASLVWGAPVAPAAGLGSPAGMRPVVPALQLRTAVVAGRPVVPSNQVPANLTNTPAATPVQPGQANLTPGFGVAQQVGTGGVPGVPSFTEGFGTSSAFSGTEMNQPGQPPFAEGVYGNQGPGTALDAPGRPNFYDGFGFNRGVVPPNQGASPTTPYPNYTTPPQTAAVQVVPASQANGASTVGFYNGFGGGQPDFGFYAGFTAPR